MNDAAARRREGFEPNVVFPGVERARPPDVTDVTVRFPSHDGEFGAESNPDEMQGEIQRRAGTEMTTATARDGCAERARKNARKAFGVGDEAEDPIRRCANLDFFRDGEEPHRCAWKTGQTSAEVSRVASANPRSPAGAFRRLSSTPKGGACIRDSPVVEPIARPAFFDMTSPILAPSILAADYARFGEEALRAERAGGDWLHVDIMDGHFVPNISFGPEVAAALKRSTRLPLDVHLMIARPDLYLDRFVKAGASRVTVHLEAAHDVGATLRRIREAGLGAGLALNPKTPMEEAEPYLARADLVLCMTVEPGFGGQAFLREVLDKVRAFALHPMRRKNPYRIEVDGGIDVTTAEQSAEAGADTFVAGTSLFAARDMARELAEMRQRAERGLRRFEKAETGT